MIWEIVLLSAYIAASYLIVSFGIRWFWKGLPSEKYDPNQRDHDRSSRIE